MSDKTINGDDLDRCLKEHLVSIGQNLSPVQSTDGYLAYSSLLLAWILEGETEEIRVARTVAIRKAHSARLMLPCWERQITYPEFLAEAEKIVEFLT